ncbi:hypothetical protein D3C87_1518760 [compost metagenome]
MFTVSRPFSGPRSGRNGGSALSSANFRAAASRMILLSFDMVNRLLLSHLGSLLSFITRFAFSETSDAAANQWCREILLNEKRTVWRDGSV